MDRFIYVFNESDKERLQKEGFVLLKEDKQNSVFVFAYNDKMNFALTGGIQYTATNVLTF